MEEWFFPLYQRKQNNEHNARIYSKLLDHKINLEMVCGLEDTNWIMSQKACVLFPVLSDLPQKPKDSVP